MTTEAEEVADLKQMFARNIRNRPPWDDTPLRNRPSALVGLKPVTREPWAIDEDVYNRKHETRDVGIQGARGPECPRSDKRDARCTRAQLPPSALTPCVRACYRFALRALGDTDRYLDQTARTRFLAVQSVDAMNRFNMKYESNTPTQGGVLGGDPVRPPPPAVSPMKARKSAASSQALTPVDGKKSKPATSPSTAAASRTRPSGSAG